MTAPTPNTLQSAAGVVSTAIGYWETEVLQGFPCSLLHMELLHMEIGLPLLLLRSRCWIPVPGNAHVRMMSGPAVAINQ